MSKDPAFLFYYRDFLVSTELWPPDAVGVYIRALCHQADKGSLTKSELTAILGEHWALVSPKFLRDSHGNFYNKKLREVMLDREYYCKSRQRNALKGHFNRKHMQQHMQSICGAPDGAPPNANANANTDGIGSKKEGIQGGLSTSPYLEIALYLKKRILEVAPEARHTEAQLASWADSVRLMVERDSRTLDGVRAMIDWVFSQPERNRFSWGKVIRSMNTLRQRWNEGKIGEQRPVNERPQQATEERVCQGFNGNGCRKSFTVPRGNTTDLCPACRDAWHAKAFPKVQK